MTVLLVASYPDSLVSFRGALIRMLIDCGAAVHIAVPDQESAPAVVEKLRSWGVHIHPVNLNRGGVNPFDDVLLLVSLWRLMLRIQPDIVLGYTIKPVVYGMMAAGFVGVPRRFALITGLGYAFTDGRGADKGFTLRRALRWLVQKLYRFSLARADKVFFQNPDDEALFRELNIVRPGAETHIVNGSGIDVQEFSPTPVPEGPPVFLMIARLLGDKGVREYVAAARKVRAAYPDSRFQLVGWIHENPDSIDRSELEDWEREGVVEYLGKLDDVRPVIAQCTVYVLPSYREGTPRTVLEAMAMGRAVITTDAPGCRETVVDGENGFLVPVKSVDALEKAMLRFIEEPELATTMGQASRRIAEDKYDVEKVNRVMLREMGIEVGAASAGSVPVKEEG